ncbi:MAG: acyl carrier protein [Candidatus Rokubacteria bacterium]|nr:acyl carrier protein [Candidatus Rokubacteria bacterium]
MTDADILAGIRDVARTHLNVEREIGADTVLVETLALDSLAMLTLVAELENRFRVCFEDGDEAGLTTVGDLMTVLRRRLS